MSTLERMIDSADDRWPAEGEVPDDALGQALFRLEQLVGAARPRDHPQPLEEGEGVCGLRQEAAGEP